VLLSKVLSNGLRTDGMSLFAITDGDARIGWMWLGDSPSDPAAGFVFDIIIEAEARARGYGRAAMLAAEQFFRSQGKARVALNVFGGNDTARGLYESLGYLPTSTSMAKSLEA
jgi:ribosomal protein S18 acetylase RimI-like enzyme